MSHDHHRAGEGPVVLDVGGDVGALVLYTGPGLTGAEIEITRVGHDRDGAHVAVHQRTVGGRRMTAAVYPALRAGSYVLWQPDGRPTAAVDVGGGRVTEVRWADIAG